MEEQGNIKPKKKLIPFWRHVLEVGFIIFLFYSNLLMGEYTHSRIGYSNGLLWSVQDIFTLTNFIIALVLAIIGHLVFEYLRKRL